MKLLPAVLRLGFVLLIVAMAAARVHAQIPANYTVVDLGTLRTDGTGSSDAHGINSQGDIVGAADGDDGRQHAFLWQNGAGIKNLELFGNGNFTIGGDASAAYGISYNASAPARLIAGEALDKDPPNGTGLEHALLIDFLGTVDINGQQAFNGGQSSASGAVNSSGVAVGWATLQSGGYHGFRYEPSGAIIDLGTLGGDFSDATAINSTSDIVGFATDANGASSAAFWSHSAGSAVPIPGLSLAYGINDNGLVVGGAVASNYTSVAAAAYNTASSGPVPLAPFPNQSSIAFAVNNYPVAVGAAGGAQDLLLGNVNATLVAVAWDASGVVDLNTRITDSTWDLAEAEAINDAGQIVGVGFHNGNRRGFLLDPPMVTPPTIISVTAGSGKVQSVTSGALKLIVQGTNFHTSAKISINGTPVPSTVYKSSTRLIAKGGSALKAMVPKGVTVQVTVKNVDDGGVSAPYSFRR